MVRKIKKSAHLVSVLFCKIRNCYNIGEVLCKNSSRDAGVGGITGSIQNGYANLDNNYNKANVNATSSGANVGGVIGKILNNPQITITNCKTTTSVAIGLNEATSSNATITNVTSNQSQIPDILSIINIDNEGVFVKDTKTNNGDPILKWQKNVK